MKIKWDDYSQYVDKVNNQININNEPDSIPQFQFLYTNLPFASLYTIHIYSCQSLVYGGGHSL